MASNNSKHLFFSWIHCGQGSGGSSSLLQVALAKVADWGWTIHFSRGCTHMAERWVQAVSKEPQLLFLCYLGSLMALWPGPLNKQPEQTSGSCITLYDPLCPFGHSHKSIQNQGEGVSESHCMKTIGWKTSRLPFFRECGLGGAPSLRGLHNTESWQCTFCSHVTMDSEPEGTSEERKLLFRVMGVAQRPGLQPSQPSSWGGPQPPKELGPQQGRRRPAAESLKAAIPAWESITGGGKWGRRMFVSTSETPSGALGNK